MSDDGASITQSYDLIQAIVNAIIFLEPLAVRYSASRVLETFYSALVSTQEPLMFRY